VRPDPEGEPRSVRLGLGNIPTERTAEAYVSALATAAQYADIVLVQRAPPWRDFMPGGQISDETANTTHTELALLGQYRGLSLFYGIDPTDGMVRRSRLANPPPEVDQQVGFLDTRLKNAFVAYAAYVAKNYRPDYLALGVEINMLYERSRTQFDAFVEAYREAYRVAKAASPQTLVFPTFQLEDLEGSLDTPHSPHWEVLDVFRGSMDALAVSTYPYLGGLRKAADIRPDYFAQLTELWDGPVLIAETGYTSAPVEGSPNVGTEEDQQAYLQRLLRDAEENNFEAVVWLAARDPAFASEGGSAVLRDIGLRKSDGSNKLAWTTWEEWARRPLAPASKARP
jgi:hypothetical protein